MVATKKRPSLKVAYVYPFSLCMRAGVTLGRTHPYGKNSVIGILTKRLLIFIPHIVGRHQPGVVYKKIYFSIAAAKPSSSTDGAIQSA